MFFWFEGYCNETMGWKYDHSKDLVKKIPSWVKLTGLDVKYWGEKAYVKSAVNWEHSSTLIRLPRKGINYHLLRSWLKKVWTKNSLSALSFLMKKDKWWIRLLNLIHCPLHALPIRGWGTIVRSVCKKFLLRSRFRNLRFPLLNLLLHLQSLLLRCKHTLNKLMLRKLLSKCLNSVKAMDNRWRLSQHK